MKRLDSHTVKLTSEEIAASDLFEEEMSDGVDRMVALAAVLRVYPDLSDEFQAYLVE